MYIGPGSLSDETSNNSPQANPDVTYGSDGSNTGAGLANRQNQYQFSDGSASGSANAYGGYGSYTWAAEPQENSRSGPAGIYGPENLEPVFSDVSDLEPVYSFSSRSSYQRGRAVFAQSRYTPGEPSYQVMPIVVRASNTPPIRNDPVDAAVKRGY